MSSEVISNRITMLQAERGTFWRELTEALGVHYQTVGYLERGSTARACIWRCGSPCTSKDLGHLRPADLALLEDFHTMGRIPTAQLADLAGITPGDEVLDTGSGIGGTARYLAERSTATWSLWTSARNTVRPHGGSTSLPGLTTGSRCAKETSPTCRSMTRPSH